MQSTERTYLNSCTWTLHDFTIFVHGKVDMANMARAHLNSCDTLGVG